MRDYAATQGYTLLLDVSNQSSNVLWTLPSAHSDISQAVVDAYNKASGIAAPPPPAPQRQARRDATKLVLPQSPQAPNSPRCTPAEKGRDSTEVLSPFRVSVVLASRIRS